MCESDIFIIKGKQQMNVMKNAARLIIDGKKAICIDILGNRKEIANVKFREADLLGHKLVLEKAKGINKR